MKKITLLTALALVGISSATLRADGYHGFIYNIVTQRLSEASFSSYTQSSLTGISSNWVIGYAGNDDSNPFSADGFLTNVVTHASRVINVPGSTGVSVPTAICGNIVAGSYDYGRTNVVPVVPHFLYNITSNSYTTNITFTNSYPWATNDYLEYTSETYAVANNWYMSNSYTTNYDTYINSNTISTNNGINDIIVYKISNGSSALVKYPTNGLYSQLSCYPAGISSNIVVGTFWGSKNSTNWTNSSTNGSFYYNADTRVYRELPLINGNTPNASAISGSVILGSWSESVEVSSNSWSYNSYLFQYSTLSNSYISTNISAVTDYNSYQSPSEINAFEGNSVVGTLYKGSISYAYFYNISLPINPNNPIVAEIPYSRSSGISGDYAIGNSYIPTPYAGGGGGSVSNKKHAKKHSVKKASKKKSSKKKSSTRSKQS